MEFHQLRYFVAAAEELNMTRAAERVHVSQPALSRQISALEEEIGVALFHRVKKRITLTEAGQFFLPRARKLLCDAETSVQLIRETYGDAVEPSLRIGLQTPFLDDIVAPALRRLRRDMPSARVQLFEMEPQGQLERLNEGALDLAIVGNLLEAERDRFEIRTLLRTPMEAVLPEDHPLADQEKVSLAEIAADPHISLSDAAFPGRRRFLTALFASGGREPSVVIERDSISLLIGEVASGNGVALLPRHSRKLPHAGCVFVPLDGTDAHAEVMLVFPRRPPVGRLFDLIARLEESATAAASSEP